MTYYEPGMPPDLHRADAYYADVTRRVRLPGAALAHLGVALKYAQEYFKAKSTASATALELIKHLDRCDTCRGTGWESCEEMKAHLSTGKSFTTMSL